MKKTTEIKMVAKNEAGYYEEVLPEDGVKIEKMVAVFWAGNKYVTIPGVNEEDVYEEWKAQF